MPRTFDEILARFDDDHAYDGDNVIEALNDAREAVGGDPSEWWVEDADGNHVHIGDEVRKGDEPPNKVMGLGVYGEAPVVFVSFSAWNYADRVHKIVPDTREKIIEDTLAKLDQTGMYRTSLVTESVEQAVDRAMKLAEVDA